MADDSKKKPKRTGWVPLSNSKLEADVAYFEARLSMLSDKPATSHQHAQFVAYTALENILSETLQRLTEQQSRRKKLRASSEVPLADQLDNKDIELLIEEGREAAASNAPPASDAAHLATTALPFETSGAGVESAAAESPLSAQEVLAEVLAEEADPLEQPVQESSMKEPQSADEEPLSETESEGLWAEKGDFGSFGSENVYLRNALFSENISFLQDPEHDPVEVMEEWGDVEEAEIKENIGNLDTPVELGDLEAGVAELEAELARHEAAVNDARSRMRPDASEKSTPADKPQEPPKAEHNEDEFSSDEDYSDSFFNSWLNE